MNCLLGVDIAKNFESQKALNLTFIDTLIEFTHRQTLWIVSVVSYDAGSIAACSSIGNPTWQR